MPFRRGYKRSYAMRRKYKPRYKKSFRKRNFGMRMLRKVFVQSKGEKKHADNTFIFSNLDTDGEIANLLGTGLTQGLGSENYIGRRVYFSGLKVSFTMQAGSTAKVAVQFVRLIVGTYSASNIPAIGNILDDTSTPITSLYEMTTAGKFNILYDKVFTIAGNGDGGAGTNIAHTGTFYRSLKNKQVMISAASNGFPVNFNLFLFAIGNAVDPTTNSPDITLSTRVYYHDN